MVAAKEGRAIPEGWALDADGQPTLILPKRLKGSMAPAGGVSNARTTVELFMTVSPLAHTGFEADSFFDVEGNKPNQQFFSLVGSILTRGGSGSLLNAQ